MEEAKEEQKKKKGLLKYIFYIIFVLVATGLALFFSLYEHFDETIVAISQCRWEWLVLILAVVIFSVLIDALIIYVFCRLYTKQYHLHSAIATSLIGSFYSGITPSSSGGQIMQVYTLKKQGIEVSNAASIFVMWFILYQISLIGFGLVALIFKWNLFASMGNIDFKIGDFSMGVPVIPLIFIGFGLNLFVIASLFLMSYSHKFHNFIMHYGVAFFAKIKIIKNPDKIRESLRIQVENFKVELRRLQSNIPVTILIICLFLAFLICRFSIPWFAGGALNAYGDIVNSDTGVVISHTGGDYNFVSFFDACFLSSFHQMITGLIPTPGSAGVSELFFSLCFANYYMTVPQMTAAQILWRTSTFHVLLLIGGLTAAFYRASPKEETYRANRQTFVDLQLETYEERKKTSDTLFETAKLSRKEIQRKLTSFGNAFTPQNKDKSTGEQEDIIAIKPLSNQPQVDLQKTLSKKEQKRLQRAKAKQMKKEKQLIKSHENNENEEGWTSIDIGDKK